jgi:hypothetical protein
MSRVEEFWTGLRWSLSRGDAELVFASSVAQAVRDIGSVVPETYFMGTAQHESNYATNERDTEETGFQSWGIYQVSVEEAHDVGMAGADLLDLKQATQVMVRLAEARRHALRAAARIGGPDPPDVCAYLAIAHNQGLHAALVSIQHYGLDWQAYRRRNPAARIVVYGDDCIPRGATDG